MFHFLRSDFELPFGASMVVGFVLFLGLAWLGNELMPLIDDETIVNTKHDTYPNLAIRVPVQERLRQWWHTE